MTFGSVRRATEIDAPELVRLRAVMLASMGRDVGPEDALWREHAVAGFEARLTDTDGFAAFVVDAPGELLAACAVAWVVRDLPGPAEHSGERGFLANVCTDERWRGQGLARGVVTAADEWLSSRRISVAHLAATPDGEGLYRSLGWTDPQYPTMVRRFQQPS